MCESGSDSGSSSGSVRASRGSWGSWSSASSMEGDKDASARTHACTTSSRKSKEHLYTAVSRKIRTVSTLLQTVAGNQSLMRAVNDII